MKNKVITALLMAAVLMGTTACGSSAIPSASDLTTGRGDRDGETEEVAQQEAEMEETQTQEQGTKAASGVVFGSEEAKGYTGFEYLTEQIISTSETKSGEKMSFSVFIPDDYTYVSGASASGDRMGVDFEVDIEPYLQYKAEDYTISENLEQYVEDEFSYATYYYGVEIGEVEEIGDSAAVCEVSYMYYNSYDDSYAPYYQLYYLTDMGDNVKALIEISIDADETTGKTQSMLDELSSFYQVDINWDSSFAEAKRTAFEDSDEYNADAFNLGYMSFELPEGWGKDEKNSSYDEDIFAPGGNAVTAFGYISVSKDYSTRGTIDGMLADTEMTKSMIERTLEDEDAGDIQIEVEDAGETFMGRTLRVDITYRDSDDVAEGVIYYGQEGSTMYTISAFLWEVGDTEAEEEIQNAVDTIMETGVVR